MGVPLTGGFAILAFSINDLEMVDETVPVEPADDAGSGVQKKRYEPGFYIGVDVGPGAMANEGSRQGFVG